MLKKINKNWEIYNNLKQTTGIYTELPGNKIILSKLIMKDMMYYTKIWRLIRGYSTNGQRSHSNNKTNKKNKSLNMFRIQQFYKLFGKKRRDIFPTLILAEYNNRLWYTMWRQEWVCGWVFMLYLAEKNQDIVNFDPQLLSKNIITGVIQKKKKKKTQCCKKKNINDSNYWTSPIIFTVSLSL